jgi:hypothetical protein
MGPAELGWRGKELDRPASGAIPVSPVGKRGEEFVMIDRSGEIRAMTPAKFTRAGILSLFDGDTAWLHEAAPVKDRKGGLDWDHEMAMSLIMAECAAAGLCGDDEAIRGVGLWPDVDGVVSHGGAFLVHWRKDGPHAMRAGRRINDAIYPMRPAGSGPSADAATREDGLQLRKDLSLWNWADDLGPDLALGWIGAALMGAVSAWHPHLLVSADYGSGKSALCRLIGHVLGVSPRNNFSEAGLRAILTNEARGVVLDEAEGGSRFDKVVELIRHMATEGGASVLRGVSGGGAARTSTVVGSVMMAGIAPPALKPQDRSRITELELRPLQTDPQNAGAALKLLTEAQSRAEKMGSAFIARAAQRAEDYRAGYMAFRAALVSIGASPRHAEQLGALLAGREMLTADAPPSTAKAEAGARRCHDLLARMQLDDEERSPGLECLAWLFGQHVEAWKGGAKETIGGLVRRAQESDGLEHRAVLPRWGLRVEIPDKVDEAPSLLVANSHAALERIYGSNDEWSGRRWSKALAKLDGAAADPPKWFEGVKSRSVRVPGKFLPPPLDPSPVPPSRDPEPDWTPDDVRFS